MDREQISIIIPVYNVKDYLTECLESVIHQTYRSLEIIIVDDGSTDGSSIICDKYEQLDKRIKVLHQQNEGVARARKRAISCATGKYICFVDSDDTIDCGMIEFFVNNIEKNDMITSGCCCETVSGETYERKDAFLPGKYETEAEMEYIIDNMIIYENRLEDGVLPFLVNKMYKADILKNVIEDIDLSLTYAEDRDLLFRYILKCKSIRITDKSFYFYRYRKSSAVRTANKNFMRDLNALYLSLERVFEQHSQRKALMHQLQLFITSRTYVITKFMGFPIETQSTRYIFPFSNLAAGSKIILYGAGLIGNNYYRQILGQEAIRVVLWVDKNWKKYSDSYVPIVTPDAIKECEYDYVIIAVREEELSNEIKKELQEKGVVEEKILWSKPINIVV